jgi:hypothetical protein
MDVNDIWNHFLDRIISDPLITSIEKKPMAGIPFVYVTSVPAASLESITESLKTYAVKAMKGKRITLELTYVRAEKDQDLFVFRMRFLVPQEKMFCCGNLCFDCIRFRDH